jgi:hypothetical protein
MEDDGWSTGGKNDLRNMKQLLEKAERMTEGGRFSVSYRCGDCSEVQP